MTNIATGNRELMQHLNIRLVLDVIRKKAPISQVDISRITHLSSGTVTNITKILKKKNLVGETGLGKSRGGRKPVLLNLNPETQFVMSASFFADEMVLAVLNLTGNIEKKIHVPSEAEGGAQAVFRSFVRAADSLLHSLHLDKKKVLGLGVSFEGIFDERQGVLVLSSRFAWRDVPVRDSLRKLYGLRTFVDSDGRAMALGEYNYGVGKGTTNMVCVDIDSGIGTASIFDGNIYRGTSNMEGEIGHSLVVLNGLKCRCGKRGCLETVASGSAFIRRMKKRFEKDKKFNAFYGNGSKPEREVARYVFNLAKEGDRFVLKTVSEIGYHLGLAVANIMNYSDPELVVLTGYMVNESGGLVSDIIKDVAVKHVVNGNSRELRIEQGILGEDASLIGAACLVYRDLFSVPVLYT